MLSAVEDDASEVFIAPVARMQKREIVFVIMFCNVYRGAKKQKVDLVCPMLFDILCFIRRCVQLENVWE